MDLLPNPGLGAEWTRSLPTDEGHESDQIFEFDGSSTAAVVPASVLDESLSHTFTVATWMKHKQNPDQDRRAKEHILCSADDHSELLTVRCSVKLLMLLTSCRNEPSSLCRVRA